MKRIFTRSTLTVQMALLGAALMLGAALVYFGLTASAITALHLAVIAGMVLMGALTLGLFGGSIVRAHNQMAQVLHHIRRDDPAVNLHTLHTVGLSSDWQAHTQATQRTVEAFRQRIQKLEALVVSLENRLQDRTRKLNTLVDLSDSLVNKSAVKEMLDEALSALQNTVDYASASVWARDEKIKEQVALLSYKLGSHIPKAPATLADTTDTNELAGLRLSKENLQVYEQIEQQRQPIIVNSAKRNIFSWLWNQLTDDAPSAELYRSTRAWLAVPLHTRNHMLGLLRVDHTEPNYFDSEHVRLLNAIGNQTALAMSYVQAQTQAQELAVLMERHRIARDLHDAVSQTLFAANVIAGTLVKTAERDEESERNGWKVATLNTHTRQQLEELQRLNRGALAEMRVLMFEMRPDVLEHANLSELMRHATDALASRTGMQVKFICASGVQLPNAVKMQLYRIAQEAFNNITKHSQATQVTVELNSPNSQRCLLHIADNGIGFNIVSDPYQQKAGHFGLSNMHERAQEIQAEFVMTSATEAETRGTHITVIWQAPELATAEVTSEYEAQEAVAA